MPFMIGNAPVRRTLKYLKNCKIIFKDNVRIFSISYSPKAKHHEGVRDFVFWHLAQIQYNNPDVQVVKLKDLTPTPFIKLYLEDEEPILVDLDCRKRKEIYNLLCSLPSIIKTEKEQKNEEGLGSKGHITTYFGTGCRRHCLCEIFGQVPCPHLVPVPKDWRGIINREQVLRIPTYIKKWGLENKEDK